MSEAQRPATSPLIYVALGLFVLAVASPFIGAALEPDDDSMILGPFFAWVFLGAGAGLLGIVSTIVGAWRAPRSPLTKLAIAVAVIFVIVVTTLLALLLR